MELILSNSKVQMGKVAAEMGASLIQKAILENGSATIIVATGASQFEMLNELVDQDVDWTKVSAFHLDEYIGISDQHPASFRKYLKERFVDKLSLKEFNYVHGDVDPYNECHRLGEKISKEAIDVAFIGIGENGHLAFNDPPADFETEEPYIVVNLDEKCRKQQMGEGWFETVEDVPKQAISMSIQHIMKSSAIICTVPDERKAEAVKGAIEGNISTDVPASILQNHQAVWMYLDKPSASLLRS
jgi:glucosamine-6-phosphate deaminase